MTERDVGGPLAHLSAADGHRSRAVRLPHRRVDATQTRVGAAQPAAAAVTTSGGSGIGGRDGAAGGSGVVRRLRGREVVQSEVDSLSGSERDQPRRVARPTAGVGGHGAGEEAGLGGDDDRTQTVAEAALRRHHCPDNQTSRNRARSTQPCIPPGSLNRVAAMLVGWSRV